MNNGTIITNTSDGRGVLWLYVFGKMVYEAELTEF